MKSLFLLGLAASQACVGQATISDSGGLRASKVNDNDNDEREFKRQSVIRRLYGPDNGEVRKHVRLLEERSERSQTGFLGDSYHEVPYENHPYQATYDRRKRERQRNLQASEWVDSVEEGTITTVDTTTTTTNVETGNTQQRADPYKPLRIVFETQALDDTRNAENAAKIDFIKTQILPK